MIDTALNAMGYVVLALLAVCLGVMMLALGVGVVDSLREKS